MPTWLKENGPSIGALTGVVAAFIAVLQFVVVGPMSSRFDDLRSDVNDRFGLMEKYMNARFDAVDERFDAVDQRFDAVDQRFEAVDQRFDAVDQRLEAVEQRLGRLGTDVSALRSLSDRISRNEERIDQVAEQLRAAPTPGP
ncbi:MAG: hypothetical protein OXP66_06930 [Candidatus Tectomicrobia bacterium]|nr:hypothetical protein [Candidatus Tectomicrobia bacterium]